MLIETDDDRNELRGESLPGSAASQPAGPSAFHEAVLTRVFRARMPYAMLSFLGITAAAAIAELSTHPERTPTYAFVYALEAQVWLVALTLTRSDGLNYARAVVIALLTTMTMMALITGYHIAVSSDAAVLLVTLSYVTVGAMVVFPWPPQAQLAVAAASVMAYGVGLTAGVQPSASSGLDLLGLAVTAALTVGSVRAAEQYRRRFVELVVGEQP